MLAGASGRRGVTAFAPLRVPRFRALWSANLLANTGAMAQAVTAAWLMTRITAGDAALVASVQTAAALPLVLLSLPAGALADLFDRRRVMIAAQCLTSAAAAGMLALIVAERVTAAALLAFTFAGGAGFALANPAWHASQRDQIGDMRLLEPAILLNAVGFNLARSVGPALGGGLIALAGPVLAASVSAVSVLPLIAALAHWRPPGPVPANREPLLSAVTAGLRYVAFRPTLAALTLRAALFTFCGASVWALTPVLVHDRLGGAPGTLGLLVAMFGAGAFAGAMTRAHFAGWQRAAFLAACTLLYAAATATLAATRMLPLAMAAMTVAGAAWVAGLSGLNVAIQLHAARWVAARAIASLQVALFLGLAAGSFAWGVTADRFGLMLALSLSAAAMLLTLTLQRWLPIVSDDAVDLTPALAEMAAAGGTPAMIARHYRVHADHVAQFHDLMRELRRARRRDGARRWSLTQESPSNWVERFELPDAAAEQRFHARHTQEDAKLARAIQALLKGENDERH